MLVPLVDTQVSDAAELLALGEGSSLVLLESIVRAYDIKIRFIDLRLDQSRAASEIVFLVGPEPDEETPSDPDGSEDQP